MSQTDTSHARDFTHPLQSLLQKHCPNGVEFKTLGEVCELKRGKSITAKQVKKGEIPVVAGGQSPAYYHNEANRFNETISVAGSGAYAGYVMFWDKPIFLSDAFSVAPLDSRLSIKFIYYFLKSKQSEIYATKKGSGVPHVYPSSIEKFKIPLPPLAVQEKIVEILDTFTELQKELQAELQRELHARRKQYEYYREQLLSFKEMD